MKLYSLLIRNRFVYAVTHVVSHCSKGSSKTNFIILPLSTLVQCTNNLFCTLSSFVLKNQINMTLYFPGFYLPYFFLPDYALESGFTAQAGALLVTIAGASSFVARIVSGYVSDKPFADPPKICGILLIIGGAATMAAPFMTSYVMLCVYSVFLGLSFGNFILTS